MFIAQRWQSKGLSDIRPFRPSSHRPWPTGHTCAKITDVDDSIIGYAREHGLDRSISGRGRFAWRAHVGKPWPCSTSVRADRNVQKSCQPAALSGSGPTSCSTIAMKSTRWPSASTGSAFTQLWVTGSGIPTVVRLPRQRASNPRHKLSLTAVNAFIIQGSALHVRPLPRFHCSDPRGAVSAQAAGVRGYNYCN
jgi:hypothetical protein